MTDWQSLSDQLKSLGVQLGKEKPFTKSRLPRYPIEEVVEGRFHNGIYGQVFCHQELYNWDYRQGTKPLSPSEPIATLGQWAKTRLLSLDDLQDFIFLDTETSGLAGGTGTYAFQVGVGRFTDDGFQLAQFFMRHPGEEPALLAELTEFIDGMKAVISYNGKSFDIPLLNTRYTLMGLSSPFLEVDHFDLLPLARRLWRIRLESRTLGNVETQILGVKRSEDEVPGYLIPEIYFEYLKTNDARPMAGVFYHNAIDILSLAGLFSHMAFLLNDPHSEKIQHAEDVVALARFFEAMGDTSQAEILYQKALKSDLQDELYLDTLERYAFLLKRKGDWEAAIQFWQKATKSHQLYAFVELAKYYEHRVRDIVRALQWTNRGIETLEKHFFSSHTYRQWRDELEHRLKRLQRKLAQLDQGY